MKKILSLILAILVISTLSSLSIFAATPQEIVIDMATELEVVPGCEAGDDEVDVAGKSGAYSFLVDGKILMEANGENSIEQFPRPVIHLTKQVDANTYKWMVIEINYGDATLFNTSTSTDTTQFTPFMAVGYVESDVASNPSAWINVNSQAAALITTPETFEDDFTNKTFDVSDVKEGTTTLLVQLPDSAAAGFNNYLNYIYLQPFGWGAACTSTSTLEITSIKFYSANPYATDEEAGEDAGDEPEDDDSELPEDENNENVENNQNTNDTSNSANDNATTDTAENTEGGCGSVIGSSVIAVATIAGAVVLLKKKKED